MAHSRKCRCPSSVSRLRQAASCLLATLLIAPSVFYWAYPGHASPKPAPLSQAAIYERFGAISQADFLRLERIQRKEEQTRRISSADFDWAMRLFAAPPLKPTTQAQTMLHSAVISRLLSSSTQQLLPGQRERLEQAAVMLAHSKLPWDRFQAASSLWLLNDQQSRQLLAALAHDPAPQVAGIAKSCLAMPAPARLRASSATVGAGTEKSAAN